MSSGWKARSVPHITEVESTTEVGNSTDELVSTAETDEVTAETGIEAASIKIDVRTAEAGGELIIRSLHTSLNTGATTLSREALTERREVVVCQGN